MRRYIKATMLSLLACAPLLAAPPIADNDDGAEDQQNKKKSGKVSGDASTSAVATSMMLWGLGIAAVVTVLSLTVGGSSSHSH